MMREIAQHRIRWPGQPRDLQRRFPRRLRRAGRDRRHALVPLARRAARGLGPRPGRRGSAGIEFIEFVDDRHHSAAFRAMLGALGFRRTHRHRSKDVELLRQGGINLVLNLEDEGFAALVPAPARAVGGGPGAAGRRCCRRCAACHPYAGQAILRGRSARTSSRIPAVRGVGGSLLYFVDRPAEHAPSRRSTSLPDPAVPAPTDLGLHRDRPCGPGRAAGRVPELDPVLPRHPRTGSRGAGRPQRPARPDRQPGAEQRRPQPATAAQRLPGAGLGRRPLHGAHGGCGRAAHRLFLPGRRSPSPTACRTALQLPIPDNYYEDLSARFGLDDAFTERLRAESILYDRVGGGEFLHFFTRTINGLFFEVVERRGGYDRYGEANAAVRLASQAMLDQTPSEALTAMSR